MMIERQPDTPSNYTKWWEELKKTVGESTQKFLHRFLFLGRIIADLWITISHRIHTQKRRVAFSCTPFGLPSDFLHGFCCIAASPYCECLFTNVPEVPVGEPHLAKE